MKKLELSLPQKKTFLAPGPGKAFFIVHFLGVFAALAILLLAFWLYRFPAQHARVAVIARSLTMLELAGEAAVKPLQNIRYSLALLARMPVLRQFKQGGFLLPSLKATRQDLQLLIESYETQIAQGWQVVISFERSLAWWSEIPEALLRRIKVLLAMQKEADFDDIEDSFPEDKTVSDTDHNRIFAQTQLVPQSIARLSIVLDQVFIPAMDVAEIIDVYLGFRNDMLTDISSAENLLAVALNDGLYRTIVLKNLQGSVIALVGDSDAADIRRDGRDCQAIARGVPFFSGPTGYDSLRGKPLWWVAVPVRDDARRPLACLTALVDISYLSDLAGKLASEHEKLFFVDRSGVAIGHADHQMVARHVSLRSSLLSVEDIGSKPLSRIYRQEGQPVFQAAAALKNAEYRYLPDWYVFLNSDLNSLHGNEFYLITVCVILLAATGIYALSCCVVRLINSSNEEN